MNSRSQKSFFNSRIPALIVLIIILGVVAALYFYFLRNPERLEDLQRFGYLGVFLTSIILNATVFLPAGNFIVMAISGVALNLPVLVGLAGGAGAAIGELSGYLAGYSGRAVILKQKSYDRIELWVKKWGMLTVIAAAAVPLFFDLVGVASGVLRVPLWKFLVGCFIGRSLLYIVIAVGAYFGWELLGLRLPYF